MSVDRLWRSIGSSLRELPGVALALALGLIVALVGGTWLLGAVIAQSTGAAFALTTGWFVVLGAAVVWLCWRRRELRPVLGGTFAAICAVSLFGLWFTTIRETEVDERLETGRPASSLPEAERPDVDALLAPQP